MAPNRTNQPNLTAKADFRPAFLDGNYDVHYWFRVKDASPDQCQCRFKGLNRNGCMIYSLRNRLFKLPGVQLHGSTYSDTMKSSKITNIKIRSDHSMAFNFVVTEFTSHAVSNIDWRTFLMFGIFCIANFFFIPETKRKTLEDMDILFGTVDAEKRAVDIVAAISVEKKELQLNSRIEQAATVPAKLKS